MFFVQEGAFLNCKGVTPWYFVKACVKELKLLYPMLAATSPTGTAAV
jgi:hypothetical protein